MAISLVGSPVENSAISGADITLTLPVGLIQNDVVYVFVAANHASAIGTSSSGWTELRTPDLNSGVFDLRSQVLRKVMDVVPDLTIVLTNDGTTADSTAAVAYALRGVDTTTPEDATPTTVVDTTSDSPNSPSITTVTDGAWVLSFGCTASYDTGVFKPTGYSNQVDRGASDLNTTTVGGATKLVSSAGAENPPAWTGWTSGNKWHAWSVAVRPIVLAHYDLDVDAGSYAVTGTAATLQRTRQVVAGSGSFAFTGTAASLVKAIEISAGASSYAVTGSTINWWMMASAGSFAVTGKTVDLQFSQAPTIDPDAGSFAVTGTAATLQTGFQIVAGISSYAVTGASAGTEYGRKVGIDAGSYTYTGQAVTFAIALGPVSNITAPVASGPVGGSTEQIGSVLSCANGNWVPSPPGLTFTYQWRRAGTNISGATLNAYLLEQADSGAAIDCLVTATDGTITRSADSNDITCETETFTVRSHYRKVTGMHGGGTLTFTTTTEETP
ncbi:MAG: hypothetical protein V4730_12065 [Pseudomonadota bacterium]